MKLCIQTAVNLIFRLIQSDFSGPSRVELIGRLYTNRKKTAFTKQQDLVCNMAIYSL